MPVTMGAFLVASFSMVGIPATGGFISKLYLGLGSLTAGQPFFIVLIVISGLLNAAYYFPILWQAYFVHEGRDDNPRKAPSFRMDKVPVTMLAPITILAAVMPNPSTKQTKMACHKTVLSGVAVIIPP